MFSSEQIFTINGDNNRALEKVLQLAIDLSGRGIVGFYEDKNGLVFCAYNSSSSDITVYPFEATIPILVEHINQYIKKLSSEDVLRLAGKSPSVDGTVKLGWEVFHPLWYGPNELEKYDYRAIIAVRPSWIVYHK